MITLVVPMPPNLANARMHWRVKHKARQDYWNDLYVLRAGSLRRKPIPGDLYIPRPPVEPYSNSTLRSVMYLGQDMDDDNAVARHKWVLDWLTRWYYIVDDKRKHLRWESFPEQVIKRDGNYRIALTITPIE